MQLAARAWRLLPGDGQVLGCRWAGGTAAMQAAEPDALRVHFGQRGGAAPSLIWQWWMQECAEAGQLMPDGPPPCCCAALERQGPRAALSPIRRPCSLIAAMQTQAFVSSFQGAALPSRRASNRAGEFGLPGLPAARPPPPPACNSRVWPLDPCSTPPGAPGRQCPSSQERGCCQQVRGRPGMRGSAQQAHAGRPGPAMTPASRGAALAAPAPPAQRAGTARPDRPACRLLGMAAARACTGAAAPPSPASAPALGPQPAPAPAPHLPAAPPRPRPPPPTAPLTCPSPPAPCSSSPTIRTM